MYPKILISKRNDKCFNLNSELNNNSRYYICAHNSNYIKIIFKLIIE